ncbi:hypothetical protein [Paenibacillus graminis]|nr:hypothetical protein [Paenibacillus graminis]
MNSADSPKGVGGDHSGSIAFLQLALAEKQVQVSSTIEVELKEFIKG